MITNQQTPERATPPCIYLDNNASTPLAPEALEALRPYLETEFGNAASQHSYGWRAERALKTAREQLAELLGCEPREIFFTSGATESNNWVVFGLLRQLRREQTGPIHMITSSIEHACMLKSLAWAETEGVEVTRLPVNSLGQVSVEDLSKALRPHTRLVSIMIANNEIGSLQDIEALGQICRERKIYFHSDAAQAIAWLPIDLSKAPIDLLSLSAHKFYGPKGVGALFIRAKNPKVQIQPLLFGGGQERGQRAGTSHVAGIVGMGKAAELVKQGQQKDVAHVLALRQELQKRLSEGLPALRLNGHPEQRLPNNLHYTWQGSLLRVQAKLKDLAFSQGSACHSSDFSGSHVLTALGMSEEEKEGSFRLGLSRYTSLDEIHKASELLIQALQ